jgi:hypothetical protein
MANAQRSRSHRPIAGLFVLAAAVALAASRAAVAAEPAAPAQVDPPTVAEVQRALSSLDADAFVEREKAAHTLDQLVQRPELGAYLAEEFGRRLLAAETSFEVRARLEQYLKGLPRPPADAAAATAEEIAPLLDRLNGDRSAERDTAQRRLASMLAHVQFVAPIMLQVKQRLADPRASAQARRSLEAVLDQAREAWVKADPGQVVLPAVGTEQMARWIDEVVPSDADDAAARVRRQRARSELVDLLVRDDTRERLLQALRERIEATDDAATKAALAELVDFARPAMAAEVWGHQRQDPEIGQADDWEHRQHITVQHLIVGVPQMAETALRPTHFDRIDDQTAHCVSGNSLEPGDYPVGVAIPHPNPSNDVMFYLVNLDTPRRRVAYEYHLRRSEAERLLEISQRTLDHFLTRKMPLDEKHVMLLLQLDPRAVSRFVGPYVQAVADRPLSTTGADPSNQLTLHQMICSALMTVGTREAVPALEELAKNNKNLKPTHSNPFHIAWIAALAVARRDPWPGVDDWLARLVPQTQPLLLNADPVPDLGATAAGLLLERNEVSPYSFDLEPAGNDAFDRSRLAGYHFASEAGRAAVSQWWTRQQAKAAGQAAP